MTGLMIISITASIASFFIFGPSDISGACCVERTTVSTSAGLPSTYLNVTWLFASGRSHGSRPSLRSSAWRSTRRCA
jgi:hypothetical protein